MTDLSELRSNVEILQYVRKRMAELKQMQETSRAVIEEALGDNDVGTLDGKEVVTWKHVESERVDLQMLKDLYPEIYEHCTYTSKSRRFLIK